MEKNITETDKETEYIIKCQKWLFSQINSMGKYND